jgi:hypothetical protein
MEPMKSKVKKIHDDMGNVILIDDKNYVPVADYNDLLDIIKKDYVPVSKIEELIKKLEYEVKDYKTFQDEYTNGQIRILKSLLPKK